MFLNNPSRLGLFAAHPPLQSLAIVCFALGNIFVLYLFKKSLNDTLYYSIINTCYIYSTKYLVYDISDTFLGGKIRTMPREKKQ